MEATAETRTTGLPYADLERAFPEDHVAGRWSAASCSHGGRIVCTALPGLGVALTEFLTSRP